MGSFVGRSSFCFASKRFNASSLIILLGLLVYEVNAEFPCKTGQIHWIGSPGRRYKCLECPDCPEGSQPSVPCGSSVAFGTDIHCVRCQLGKTYSDKYGKRQCEACTVCSKGKAIKKNCTLSSNTECDNKCAVGFYPAPFIFACFRCEKCCGDGKDELAQECANYEKKCKARSTPCENLPTKASDSTTKSPRRRTEPSNTSTAHATQRKRRSPTTVQKSFTTVPTTQPGKTDYPATLFRALFTKPPSVSSVPPPWSANNRKSSEDREIESGEKSTDNHTYVILPTVLASIAVVLIIGLIAYNVHGRRTDFQRNSVNTVERPAQNDLAASPLQVEMNPTYSCLEQLENENQELFDWVCSRLDNGRWLIRRDYERLAAKYKLISPEERNALHDELQHKGSPSRMLMSLVLMSYPNLPLSNFVKSLKEIRRNDIVQKLMPYVRETNETSNSLAH